MKRVLAVLMILASACVAESRPPPPPPRVLSAPEAVATATHYARAHGVVVDYTRNARLDRRARWHVDLGGAGGRDRAVVILDGYSGRVLSARVRGARGEFVPPPPPPPAGTAPEPPPPMPPEPGTPPPAAPGTESPPPAAPMPPPPPQDRPR